MITVYSKVTGSLLLVLSAVNLLIPMGDRPDLLAFSPLMTAVFFVSGICLLIGGFAKQWQMTRRVILLTAIVYGFLAMVGFLQNDSTLQYSRDELFCLTLCVSALLFGVPETYAFKH